MLQFKLQLGHLDQLHNVLSVINKHTFTLHSIVVTSDSEHTEYRRTVAVTVSHSFIIL